MLECFEFGAVNCLRKRGIFTRINIIITYIYYTQTYYIDIYYENVFVNI